MYMHRYATMPNALSKKFTPKFSQASHYACIYVYSVIVMDIQLVLG